MLGVAAQGFLRKRDLKSSLKIPQREFNLNVKISYVKLHKKIGVFHFRIISQYHRHQRSDLTFFAKMSFSFGANIVLSPLAQLQGFLNAKQ